MYSVLIQNQKTIESFQEYHSLFMDAICSKDIGICRWMEPGTTVDTALPELKELTDDKEEWRAIIVHVIDEENMKMYETEHSNPFDFKINHATDKEYGESAIPLVRLTHILAGIPTPLAHYEPEIIKEKNKAPRTVYKLVRNEKDEAEYDRLTEKYDFDGKEPSEVILISVRRKKKTEKEHIEQSWSSYHENESSNFWQTNNYSNKCRFIVFDLQKRGDYEHEADMFRFWNCVRILATNTIDPDELQAYRLYNMSLSIDRESLKYNLDHYYRKIDGVRLYIEHRLEQERREQLEASKELPNYSVTVPVKAEMDMPKLKEFNIQQLDFGLAPIKVDRDLANWRVKTDDIEVLLRQTVRQSERALDISAERMRGICEMQEDIVEPLDSYQRRDMKESLRLLYERVIRMQKYLPGKSKIYNDRMRESSKEVRTFMKSRITSGQVLSIMLIMIGLTLLTIAPGIVFATVLKMAGDVRGVFTVGFILLDVAVIAVLVMLFKLRTELWELIANYNSAVDKEVQKVNADTDIYSQFLSGIATHAKGSSYLQILEYKKFSLNDRQRNMIRHKQAIEKQKNIIERWRRAFYLDKLGEDYFFFDDNFDEEQPPVSNKLYSFCMDKLYERNINKSGNTIHIPFEYISKVELQREELYDD